MGNKLFASTHNETEKGGLLENDTLPTDTKQHTYGLILGSMHLAENEKGADPRSGPQVGEMVWPGTMSTDHSPSDTVTGSEDSLQKNSLHVSYPVTLTWQEISVFVKSSTPGQPQHHKAYKSTGVTLSKSMIYADAEFIENDVDDDRNGLRTEDIVIESEGKNQDCSAKVPPGEDDGITSCKSMDHPCILAFQARTDVSVHSQSDLPSKQTTEKCFRDRNMSATDVTDSSTVIERHDHQNNTGRNKVDLAAEGHCSNIHIDDFCMPAVMLDEDIQESEYDFPDKNRNVNYPGDVEMEKITAVPQQASCFQQGQNTSTNHTSDDISPQACTSKTPTHENRTDVNEKGTHKIKNEVCTGENKNQILAQAANSKTRAHKNEADDVNQKEPQKIKNVVCTGENRTSFQGFTGINETYTSEQDGASKGETVMHKKQFFEPMVYDIPSESDMAEVKAKRLPSNSGKMRGGINGELLARRKLLTGQWRPILRRLTGIAEPGTLVAVLGASGSGKSTLMNVLAGRNMPGCHVSGTVRVNGMPVKNDLHQLCAYVPQHQNFLANLTVKETLAFRATLELRNKSQKERAKMLVDILRSLALSGAADTFVGVPGRTKGLSGGEVKRLSFACELLSNPPLLLCDEPTSGLDSCMAETTVRVLRTLADLQHTVVCVIHQPASHVFGYFHKVLLLTEGHTAYLGSSAGALDFFSSLGRVCPLNYNPADFFVQVLSPPTGHATHQSHVQAEEVSKLFLRSELAQVMVVYIHQLRHVSLLRTKEIRQLLHSSVRRPAPWGLQLSANMWQFWTCLKRARTDLWANVFSCLVQTLLVGILFYRLDVDSSSGDGEAGHYTQTNVLNVNGAVFMITTLTSYLTAQHVIAFFPQWLPIVLRDYHNHLYHLHVFYLAACLVSLPLQLTMPIMVIVIDYWMVGLVPQLAAFFLALGIVTLSASTAIAFGQALSLMTGDVMSALTLSNSVMVPLLLLSGFIINVGSIPGWLQWLRYVSWFRHTNELLLVNQWGRGVERVVCRSVNGSGCLFGNGGDVLRELNLGEENTVQNFCSLAVLLVLFHALALLALGCRARRNRC